MKKFIRVLALVLVVALCATALVSCAPNANPDKAKAALDKKEYTAAHISDEGLIGGVGLAVYNSLFGVKCTDVVTGTKTVETKDGEKKIETVTIVYFASADDAKSAFVKAENDNDTNKQDSDWVCAQSGKIIYYGTKAGAKAAQ